MVSAGYGAALPSPVPRRMRGALAEAKWHGIPVPGLQEPRLRRPLERRRMCEQLAACHPSVPVSGTRARARWSEGTADMAMLFVDRPPAA